MAVMQVIIDAQSLAMKRSKVRGKPRGKPLMSCWQSHPY